MHGLSAERRIELPDGRMLQLREYGDRDGAPVVALHGTPASRIMYAAAGTAAERPGLRIIAPDRWGYGGTSPHPQPTLSAFAQDMAVLADELGLARFAVLGVSGGGPYAAALAACLQPRVTALALVSPVGPIAEIEPAALGAFHRFCFRVLPRAPGLTRCIFGSFRHGLAAAPKAALRVSMLRFPGVDRNVLADELVRQRFIEMFAEGLRPGVEGALTDMRIFGSAWDVDLGNITAPAALWIGTDDRNVPVVAARRLAAAIPGCALSELAGAGHLWIVRNYDVVLDWIAVTQSRAASDHTSGK